MEVFDIDSFASEGFFIRKDPSTVVVGIGPFERCTSYSARMGPALYAPDFFLRGGANWFVPRSFTEMSCVELLGHIQDQIAQTGPDRIQTRNWTEPSQAEFLQEVSQLQSKFVSHGWKKVVPVVFEKSFGVPSPGERLRLVSAALRAAPTLWAYGFWEQGEGIIGGTPEILLKQTAPTQLETLALAGTKGIGAPDAELVEDGKELFEHDLVVQHIAQVLRRLGEVCIGERELVRLPLIKHLKTKIALQAREELSFEALIHALHPTPALGGVPQREVVEYLRSKDPEVTRARFGAPFGIVETEGKALCLVAIRNIQWRANELLLGAGCGIVPQSKPSIEWEELALKRVSVHSLFGL